MKYYKAIKETNIGNNGNYYTQTRYEVFDLYLTKIYICGYDYVTNNTRHLEVELSENMNNYKQISI